MKKVSMTALIISSVLMAASVISVGADQDCSGIKKHILLDADSFSDGYDINNNGRTDVLDVCHLKQQILYKADEPDTSEPLFYLGEASIDVSEKKVYTTGYPAAPLVAFSVIHGSLTAAVHVPLPEVIIA